MKTTRYIAPLGVSLCTILLAGCGLLALPYTCPGGTPKSGDAPDRDNRQHCVACANPQYTVLDKQCVATEFTCSNGTAYQDGGVKDANLTKERCTKCDNGFKLEDNQCNPDLIFDTQQISPNSETSDGAAILIASSEDARLWWVIYQDGTTIDSASTVRNDATNNGGITSSDSAGITMLKNDTRLISISGLDDNTQYVFYAAMGSDGTQATTLSEPLTFTTAPLEFRHGRFIYHANGVTILCEEHLPVGTRDEAGGVTYVKRSREQITPDNAATSCTTGITDMGGMFTATAVDVNDDGDTDDAEDYPAVSGAASFNGDISHWDTSSVTNMSSMFRGATSFNQNINSWDVSKVTDMNSMFLGDKNNGNDGANPTISDWNTSSVENMSSMFKENNNFNQDISTWDVGSVTNMGNMFRVAQSFNSDIGNWDVSKVTDMGNMFRSATSFTADISEWCVSHIAKDQRNSFDTSTSNSTWPDSSQPQWGTAKGDSCAVNFTDQPTISTKDTTTATISLLSSEDATLYWILRTNEATYQDSAALKADISSTSAIQDSTSDGVGVSDTTEYDIMLDNLTNTVYYLYTALEVAGDGTVTESVLSDEFTFTPANVCGADYQKQENGSCVATAFVCDNGTVAADYADTTPMSEGEFNTVDDIQKCGACNIGYKREDDVCVPLAAFTLAENGVTVICDRDSEGTVFPAGTEGYIAGDTTVYVKRTRQQILDDSDRSEAATTCTTGITDMSNLFVNQRNFNGDISHWDTSRVTTMETMFQGSWSGEKNRFNQDIGNWDVSKVTNMYQMFRNTERFNQDIGGWDVSSVIYMSGMFDKAVFNQDLRRWCVSHHRYRPIGFSDNNSWRTQPQWNTSKGNNCLINFVAAPAVDGSAGASTTIKLTPSKDGALYWALYSTNPTTAPTLAALKGATAGTSGVVHSSGSSGVTTVDDTEQEVPLTGLTVGTTYYFYAGLALEDDSGTVIESELSSVLSFTPQ